MNATEIIVRYFVAWVCGWLSSHGFPGIDDTTVAGAIATDVLVYGVPALVIARALYTSTVRFVARRLQARHPHALLDAAAAVPGVKRIEATPQIAAATDSPAVVAAPAAGPAP